MRVRLQRKIESNRDLLEDLKKFRNGFHAMFLNKLESDDFDIIDGAMWKTLQSIEKQICVLQSDLRNLGQSSS